MLTKNSLIPVVSLILIVGLSSYFMFITIRKLNTLNKLKENSVQVQHERDCRENYLNNKLKEISNSLEKQSVDNDNISNRLDRLEEKSLIKPVNISIIENKIQSILSQVEQLEKDKVTEADFNKWAKEKWAKELQRVVDNSLIEISKPPTIETVKPMPNVTTIIQNVKISNEEKSEILKLTKFEVFKKLEQAGYGTFVDGEFVFKKPFFGAVIESGMEKDYEPVDNM